MLLKLRKSDGGLIGLNRESIWKVKETPYGCLVSVGTKTIALQTAYADMLKFANFVQFQNEDEHGAIHSVAINPDYIEQVLQTGDGNVLILKNGDKVFENLSGGFEKMFKSGTTVQIKELVSGTNEQSFRVFSGINFPTCRFTITWILTCTSQGNGTTVVGEAASVTNMVPVSLGVVDADWNDLIGTADDSFTGVNWNYLVDTTDLLILITPPNTAGTTTEFELRAKVEIV